MTYVLDFSDISMKLIKEVGIKNAAQGELFNHSGFGKISIPDGFAVTASAYRYFIKNEKLEDELYKLLGTLDICGFSNLAEVGMRARTLVAAAAWPESIRQDIVEAHARLLQRCPPGSLVAVRGSAIVEGGAESGLEGTIETILNVSGQEGVLSACRRCFVSRFSDRAIRFRVENGMDHLRVAVSTGVQRMIRNVAALKRHSEDGPLVGLLESEARRLAAYCRSVEDYFGRPMEVEWAKDGITGELFILQIKPVSPRA
jgi:pyruvate,water dikinase